MSTETGNPEHPDGRVWAQAWPHDGGTHYLLYVVPAGQSDGVNASTWTDQPPAFGLAENLQLTAEDYIHTRGWVLPPRFRERAAEALSAIGVE